MPLDSTPKTTAVFENEDKLQSTLKPRHLTMIAFGGLIGAGILVASSTAILSAGPGVILGYVMAGTVLVLVMRMLGEMASASPETGSFSAYANRFIGPWAGLSIGWLYWWFWVVVVGIEATAAAKIANEWWPAIPQWAAALVIIVVFLFVNLVSVKSFGEFEFWFSMMKVGAITLFVVGGALLIFGILPSDHESFNPANSDGGLLPMGMGGVFAALLPIAFSMFGAEMATVAAGESEHPQSAVRKAVNSVLVRLMLFYIGSMIVIVLLVPWNEIESGKSPFVSALEYAGFEWAGGVMSIVIFVALLSTMNAAMYTASRMVYSLAGRGEAPRMFRRVGKRGTPFAAIVGSTIVGFITVVLNYVAPDAVFAFLVNSTGATALFVWLAIAVSQLRSRKLLPNAINEPGVIRMWGFPWLTWIVIVAIVALLLFMTFNPNPQTRLELMLSLVVTGISVVAGVIVQRRQKKARAEASIGYEREPK
ncbi:MAG: amino acid permease [Canibacter sp.]